MKKKIIFSLFLLFLLLPTWAFGTIYYVDSAITDTNVGSATCDFTTYNPTTFSTSTGSDCVYKTIADVNAKSPSAGDSVLFRKGQTWRGLGRSDGPISDLAVKGERSWQIGSRER